MTESGQPNRDQEMENIIDEIDENGAGELEALVIPGKPSDREAGRTDPEAPVPTA